MEMKKYFLRSGDFRPEETTDDNLRLVFGKYSTSSHSIERLDADNNLFADLDDATCASAAIRSFLACFRIATQSRRESSQQTHTPSGNSGRHQGSVPPPSSTLGIQIYCGMRPSPNAETSPCPEGNSHCHGSGIRVVIQILP